MKIRKVYSHLVIGNPSIKESVIIPCYDQYIASKIMANCLAPGNGAKIVYLRKLIGLDFELPDMKYDWENIEYLSDDIF